MQLNIRIGLRRCLFVLFWLICFALLAGQALAERVALVVGNGSYDIAGELPNPPKDAKAIGAKLERMGFSVTRVIDADLASMRAALHTFGQNAHRAEIAVIFYAGHGMQADGENYLVPVDARITQRADLATTTMSASEIFSQLLAAEPEVALLILDACRDNPFITAASTAAGLSSATYSANAFVQRPNSAGMIIGFAAAPGAVAYDGGDGNSPYTTALLQWIDRPGMELGTMLRRVRSTVLELTSGAQIPWVEEALLRDVYLLPVEGREAATSSDPARLENALLRTIRAMPNPAEQKAVLAFYERFVGQKEAAVVKAAVAPETRVTPEEDSLEEALIWLSIRGSEDIAVLASFEQAFPDSPFTAMAREQIELIEVAQSAAPTPVTDITAALPGPSPQEDLQAPGALVTTPAADGTPMIAQPGQISAPATGQDLAGAVDTTPAAPALPAAPDPEEIEAGLGLDRDALAAVQMLLADGGDYAGAFDAIFGPGTRRAVAGFQSAGGLTDSGYLDLATLQLLVRTRASTALRNTPRPDRRMAIHRIAALSQSGPGAEPATLRVAALSRNDDVHAYLDALSRDFESDHPGTLVEFNHQPDWQYKANLLSMLGSENPPDLLHTWGGGHLDALREAGFVRDLTDEMASGWALEFRPGALSNFADGGQIYGAPTYVALVSLWVNAPLLEQAGISLASLETWDGFLTAVGDLKAKGIVPLAVGGSAKWPFQMIWGNIAAQLGGRTAFERAYAGEDSGFRNDVFYEASDRMRQLATLGPFQPGFLQMSEDDAGNAFARGETAMVVTGNWRLHSMGWNWPGGQDAMRRELVRLDFPSDDARRRPRPTYGGTDGYAINSQAPDVAVDLLRLLTSRAVQSRTAQIMTMVPSVSGADLVQTDPLIADVAEALLTSGYHQLYYDQALGPEAGDVVNDIAMGLGTGAIDARRAVERLGRAWDEVLVGRGVLPAEVLKP